MENYSLMRRNRYSLNRRSSMRSRAKLLSEKKFLSAEEWQAFQSCMSLKSSDLNLSNESLRSPRKVWQRNFVALNHNQVNRMSDYCVKAHLRINQDVKKSTKVSFFDSEWKDITKPVPVMLVLLLAISIFWIVYIMIRSRE